MRQETTRQIVETRIKDLCGDFANYVDLYDDDPPFRKRDQYRLHRATIDLRRNFGSVGAAVLDDKFVGSLWQTLRAWGMDRRGARLVPLDVFSQRLKENVSHMQSLESLAIERLGGTVSERAGEIWGVISGLNITEAKNPVVSGTKTLHHLIPDLVPPMDRAYTRVFFQWHMPQFQAYPRKVFLDIYAHMTRIAEKVNPQQYVGDGWRTSSTKVLDNAIVAYCLKNNLRLD